MRNAPSPIPGDDSATRHQFANRSHQAEPELVSVVIPVLNGAELLPKQLAALEHQTYRGGWELLIVDNGSTDDTVQVAKSWVGRLPIRIVDASEQRGISHARNRGLEESRGELVAFCDCDDEASPRWLEALVDAARDFDAVGGRLDAVLLNNELERSWRGKNIDSRGLPAHAGFLSYAPGGNCAVWVEVAKAVGGWNTAYGYGGDDVEFSFRLQLAGYSLGFAEGAVMHYRLRPDLRSMVRQTYRYSVASVQLYRDFRDAGQPHRRPKIVLYHWGWLGLHLHWLFAGPVKRGLWFRSLARQAGRLVGSVRYRVWCP